MRVHYRHEAGCGDTSFLSAPGCLCSLNNAGPFAWDPSRFNTIPQLIIQNLTASLLLTRENAFKTQSFPPPLCVTLRAAGDKSESTLHDAKLDGVRVRGAPALRQLPGEIGGEGFSLAEVDLLP